MTSDFIKKQNEKEYDAGKYQIPYKERCYQKDSEGHTLYSGLGTVTYEYVIDQAVDHVYNINMEGRHDNREYELVMGESRQVGGKSDKYTQSKNETEEDKKENIYAFSNKIDPVQEEKLIDLDDLEF